MAWVNICDVVYPIGAVYSSYVSTTPATLFGGTWTSITGKFPYYNAGTSTGGSNTHTLTVSEIPSHNHQYRYPCLIWVGSGGTESWPSSGTNSSGTDKFNANSPYLTNTGGGGHITTCLPIKLCTLGDALLRRVI